ncbi:hypothetical protein [Arthrobacter monumenti]
MSTKHPRPRIVCICGSVKFWPQMNELIRRLSLDGDIVVAPVNFEGDGGRLTEDDRQRLNALHLRKIDVADSVMVVCPGDYIGESTANEIAYATAAGKRIDYVP